MLLAGDVGGTRTRLGLFESGRPRPRLVTSREFETTRYAGLNDIIREFLDSASRDQVIESTVMGVAGPVHHGEVALTNVSWRVTCADIQGLTGRGPVALINDVEAMAHSLNVLRADEQVRLQGGAHDAVGNGALIAIGTGVGMAPLHRVGSRFVPLPSEGGHADFAARTDREVDLLRALRPTFGRVDIERVISGPGLASLARFTHGGRCPQMPPDVGTADEPARVAGAALDNACVECVAALRMFIEALGAVVGNLALTTKATGGVFIGGGIPAKILPALQWAEFLGAFRAKAPLESVLDTIPVTVVTLPTAGLLGAAVCADRQGRALE